MLNNRSVYRWQQRSQQMVAARWFEYLIVGLILLNAAVLGMETNADLARRYHVWFSATHFAILVVFIIEAALKIFAVAPKVGRYFRNGWNLFDFSVIVLSLVPATGELAMIARMARLLRVLRLVSAIPELRLIVSTLLRSIPSLGHVFTLISIIFYIYAVAGFHLFNQHDPQHWGGLGTSLLTLFRIVTLEDWTDVMYIALESNEYAWIYFVSFVVMGTFVIMNLFIAIVLNNLETAKLEHLKEMQQPMTKDALLRQLEDTEQALIRLRQSLEKRE